MIGVIGARLRMALPGFFIAVANSSRVAVKTPHHISAQLPVQDDLPCLKQIVLPVCEVREIHPIAPSAPKRFQGQSQIRLPRGCKALRTIKKLG